MKSSGFSFLAIVLTVFIMGTLPACSTMEKVGLGDVFRSDSEKSTKKAPKKKTTKETTSVKKAKPVVKPEEVKKEEKKPESKVTSKTKPSTLSKPKTPVTNGGDSKAKEAKVEDTPVYEPPLRGSPSSRVGGGTR